MVGSAYKGVFITRFEAIRNFFWATVFYVAIIFLREVCALGTNKSPIEIVSPASYKLLLGYGTLLYLGFLIGWGHAVYTSYKHYRLKKRQLELLLQDQNNPE